MVYTTHLSYFIAYLQYAGRNHFGLKYKERLGVHVDTPMLLIFTADVVYISVQERAR